MKLAFCVLLLIIDLLGFCAFPVEAQNTYNVETRPLRGFMPTADQLTSPVDSIDPVSGKLHLSIPLAALPRGALGAENLKSGRQYVAGDLSAPKGTRWPRG
jgi:hypothetical protein